MIWEVRLAPRTPVLLLALLMLATTMRGAANGTLEGRRITTVGFSPANQPLTNDELERITPIRAGDTYHAALIREAIQKLYSTGRYTDIAVDAETSAVGVAIRFVTKTAMFVGRVSAEGSPDPPSAGQLVTATKLELGTEFANNDIPPAVETIQDRLRANGLFGATVTPQLTRDPAIDQINIDFHIDPGKRARFSGLSIQGDAERPVQAIIRSTKWRRPFGLFGWNPMTESKLQNGLENVRNYYLRHDHLLARVTLSNLDYDEDTNTVKPALTIDPGAPVFVKTVGAKLSRGKLRQLLPIYQERSIDRSLLEEGRRSLIDYFQTEGYLDADASYSRSQAEDGGETIEYAIDRNGRHKLVKIDIEGNHYFDRSTLRERMYIMPTSFPRFIYGRYSQRYLEKDIDTIQDLYRANGFRDVAVKPAVEDDYQGHQGQVGVKLTVDEGPQWIVAGLEFEGVAEADRQYLTSIITSIPGQPFSEFNVANDRDNVLAYYYNTGYPNATFDWNESPTADENKVNLRYIVNPGNREVVRDVVVSGLHTTRPGIVNERIRIKAGDPVSQSSIADAQRRLYDLGIFSTVQTAVQNPEGDEPSKYVLYQIDEARRYSVNFGFGAELARIGGGIGYFDAPAGAPGFSPRVSLGASRLNVFGVGHTVSLQTRFSAFEQRALFSYFAPQFQGSDKLNLTFSGLYDDSRDVRTFAARRLEGTVQLGERLTRADTIQYRFTYRDNFVDPNSVKINPQLIPILSQSVRVGLIGTTLIQDRRDDPTDAHRGMYQTIDLEYAAGGLGSQTEFLRGVWRNSTYYRITRDVTFARSTNFGIINRLGGLPDIPLPERFFSGGAYSDRAFPDNQAGPRDPITGFPLGGKAVLMNSLELRFPLIGDNIGGVLFHDMGNVYTDVTDISLRFRQRDVTDFNYAVHAFGFGIRYRTPIGPIRVDLALSPNSPRFVGFSGSEATLLACSVPGSPTPCVPVPQRINIFQFHFSLGQAF